MSRVHKEKILFNKLHFKLSESSLKLKCFFFVVVVKSSIFLLNTNIIIVTLWVFFSVYELNSNFLFFSHHYCFDRWFSRFSRELKTFLKAKRICDYFIWKNKNNWKVNYKKINKSCKRNKKLNNKMAKSGFLIFGATVLLAITFHQGESKWLRVINT